MPFFFIDRPVFAWIVALAIVVAGALAIPQLPVAQYPRLAPPRIVVSATYPGASTEVVDANVGSIIEESLDGADNMLYYETTSDNLGELEIDATFAPGTNPDLALVDIQNRLKQVEPRLPQQVVQQGITVFKAANTFLMLVALTSTDGTRDSVQLSDYLSRYVLRELKRAPGVGSAQLWDADEALRIWLDPMKLREYGLGAAEVNAAIAAQNATVTAGTLGDAPFVPGQQLTASVNVRGQLISPAEFGQIVLKAHTQSVRQRDARRGIPGFAARAASRFTAGFDRAAHGYRGLTARTLHRIGPMLAVYAVLVGACGLLYWQMPGGFLPSEDEGQLQVMVQLPAGATQARTLAVVERVEKILHAEPAIANVTSVIGWSFSGSGQNAAMGFVELKDWDKRNVDALALRDRLNAKFDQILDGNVEAQLPPSVPGVGHSDGFVLRLEDRGGVGLDALKAAREQLFTQAKASPVLASVHFQDLPDAPRVELIVDRAKAYALGVSFDRIADVLGSTFGSTYIDDFPAGGRMRRVMIAADAAARMTEDDLLALAVPNSTGGMVPLSAIATRQWTIGPVMLTRYNGYPSLDVSGHAATGYSSGAAMAEMERLAGALPVGVQYDWVDAAREETSAAKLTPLLVGLSLLAVFMALAALYESWTIPLAVLMVVPLGVIGAVAAVLLRGLPNDVYFKVGMITVIGLAAKNAILIVQFARDLYQRGLPLTRAVTEAAGARFRPIVMTSAAFLLGVVPLVVSSGAGAESRRSIGTGVFGGVLAATVFGLMFAPVAFHAVASLTHGRRRLAELHRKREARRARRASLERAPLDESPTA